MQRLTRLTAVVVLLSASAAFAQSSIDAPNGGRRPTGHTSSRLRAAAAHAASTQVSGRHRSDESCGRASGPTTGHAPDAAAAARSAANPPASGAVDQHGSPLTRCPPRSRS